MNGFVTGFIAKHRAWCEFHLDLLNQKNPKFTSIRDVCFCYSQS